jgi:hypothetical protein
VSIENGPSMPRHASSTAKAHLGACHSVRASGFNAVLDAFHAERGMVKMSEANR